MCNQFIFSVAYDSDARLAFANPKSTLPQVPQALRLDKVLVESLKGAVNMIKTALPVDFQDGMWNRLLIIETHI